ncbi:hypothetical protein UM396_05125 [Geobacillus subterraneus]|uniref:hypothetical protein n=1 Tax=Geobacillus subterraneus TaxID=129338 RepID=UPI002AC8B54F|nr:hypothetical protein [Geobacillus subterraneus]WPZ19296.1 hypothetical protein UM396_05125 [Geobacillus subterraneus]
MLFGTAAIENAPDKAAAVDAIDVKRNLIEKERERQKNLMKMVIVFEVCKWMGDRNDARTKI